MKEFDYVYKTYVIFGNFYEMVSKTQKDFETILSPTEFNFSNFVEQNPNFGQANGLSFKSVEQRLTILVRFNRIDFTYRGVQKSFSDIFNYIKEIIEKFELKVNRLAINECRATLDEKKKSTGTFIDNSLKQENTENSYSELLFRFNNIIQHGTEELNIISSIENGFIQKVKSTQTIENKILKNALFLAIDANTSAKNLVFRFDSVEYLREIFNLLESKTEESLGKLARVC